MYNSTIEWISSKCQPCDDSFPHTQGHKKHPKNLKSSSPENQSYQWPQGKPILSFLTEKTRCKYIPSREWITYPTWGSSENHRLKMPFWGGYVSSMEGKSSHVLAGIDGIEFDLTKVFGPNCPKSKKNQTVQCKGRFKKKTQKSKKSWQLALSSSSPGWLSK